ncbi:MAG TPA: hypothetical protein VNT29_00550 [Candidatus Limnocylindrales bacterium]|nr:hypothetical protein [Candidatus Limnocylindrales bacterium]
MNDDTRAELQLKPAVDMPEAAVAPAEGLLPAENAVPARGTSKKRRAGRPPVDHRATNAGPRSRSRRRNVTRRLTAAGSTIAPADMMEPVGCLAHGPGGDRDEHDARISVVAAESHRSADARSRVASAATHHPTDVGLAHYGRMLLDLQKIRVGIDLRIQAANRDGFSGEWLKPLDKALDEVTSIEEGIDRHLERLAKDHPAAAWIKETRGVSLRMIGRVLSIVGSLDRFPNVAKLWSYLGLAVVNGRAPRRERGKKLRFAPEGPMMAYRISSSIVKTGGPYRVMYDRKRAEYDARPKLGPSACPFGHEHRDKEGKLRQCGDAHPHQAAMRYIAKAVLKDLWIHGRRKAAN